MNNKGIGSVFCLIAAILMSTRYLAAAIYMSGGPEWSNELFCHGLEYIGSPLKTASIVALVIGIAFLLYGFYQDANGKNKTL